jgi:hypothetical protein
MLLFAPAEKFIRINPYKKDNKNRRKKMAKQDSTFSIRVEAETATPSGGFNRHIMQFQEFTGEDDGTDDCVIIQCTQEYLGANSEEWSPVTIVSDGKDNGEEVYEEIFIPVTAIDDVIAALKVMKNRF